MSLLLQLENVRQRYGGRTVLDVERLEIAPGELLGLTGPNGSGKSTLLRILALLEEPVSGRMLVDGRAADGGGSALRRSVTMLNQEPYLLRRSVFENVAYGLRARGMRGMRGEMEDRVRTALSMVALDHDRFAPRAWRELSGGETQRVALAARLAVHPRVLLLDEPTASLDLPSAQAICAAVLRAREQWGTTVVVISHDPVWLDDLCERQVTMHGGRIAGEGRINVLPGPWITSADTARLDLGDGAHLVAARPPSPGAAACLDPADVELLPGAGGSGPDTGEPNVFTAAISQRVYARSGDSCLRLRIGTLSLWADSTGRECATGVGDTGRSIRIRIQPSAIRWLSGESPS